MLLSQMMVEKCYINFLNVRDEDPLHQNILFWFTSSFNWSSSGSQYRQKFVLSSSESNSLSLITSDRLHWAVICPSMDRELPLAEIEIPLQPVMRLTSRLRGPLPWRQVPQKFKSRSFSLEPEGGHTDKRLLGLWFSFKCYKTNSNTHSV